MFEKDNNIFLYNNFLYEYMIFLAKFVLYNIYLLEVRCYTIVKYYFGG